MKIGIKQLTIGTLSVAGLAVFLNACVPPPPAATPCPGTITAGVSGNVYAPNSCTVMLGGSSKTVTVQADAEHPLDSIDTNGQPPIVAAQTDQSVTFTTPGTYTFKCHVHGPIGMTGKITVVN
jgi:plastocyanin